MTRDVKEAVLGGAVDVGFSSKQQVVNTGIIYMFVICFYFFLYRVGHSLGGLIIRQEVVMMLDKTNSTVWRYITHAKNKLAFDRDNNKGRAERFFVEGAITLSFKHSV